MRKFLVVLFFCLPVFGQSAYTGRALYSGSSAYGASNCGPGNGYACFVQDTNVRNFSLPGPNWGPNTCDWTSPFTVQNCGNVTGANTVRTPADFGNAMVRCTDANTVAGHPEMIWTTYDAPSVNAWNSDDTGILLKVTSSGQQYLMKFNPLALACAMVTNGGAPVSFNGNAWFHHSINNLVLWYDGINQTQLKQTTVNFSTGALTTTVLYDFNNASCLTNPVNGLSAGPAYAAGTTYAHYNPVMYGGVLYSSTQNNNTGHQPDISPSWWSVGFPQDAWTGTGASSLDDGSFARGFSTLAAQGTGTYLAAWSPGQSGCDLWNTATNLVTHNGTLVGTVSDAPWGGANGGKYDRFGMHEALQTPNPMWINTNASTNTMIYGTNNDGNYFWQRGTTNVQRCGIGAPNWKASTAYNDGDRINPATGNSGDYIYQIVNGVGGTSGTAAPAWGQSPNSDNATDNGITWHNVGLGAAQQFFCDGHGWTGYFGLAPGKRITYHSYTNPISPMTPLLTTVSTGDQHFGNTNDNPTDSAWIFVMSADVGSGVNLLDAATPYPSAFYNEIYLISPPYNADGSVNSTRAFRRAAHNYNSGWHQTFDVQNGMCVLSQTGNFALCSTDGMGQFGNINGTASCNVGAPDWVKSATSDGTTTFSIGYKMYPNPASSGNTGDYIYQIQSCSDACATGSTKPTYPQTSGATVVDGTITWANTGLQQNCRADDVIVKLTR